MVANNIAGTTLEAFYNYLLNRREDHNSLIKFIESLDYKVEVLKSAGFSFLTKEIHESYLV